jgi:multiple sugar transport system permease protein
MTTTTAEARTVVVRGPRKARFTWLLLTPFLLFFVMPIFWMIGTSFKQDRDLYDVQNFPLWFSLPPTLEHYHYLFTSTQFLRWSLNTLIIVAVVVVITLLLGVPAAYVLARFRTRLNSLFALIIFFAYLLPPTLLFLPLAQVVNFLNLQDSIWSMVVTGPTRTLAFASWLLLGYFRTLPPEIEEAARLDGCNRLTALVRVIIPLSGPGILTAVFFAIALTIANFVYPLTFISSSSQMPLSVGVATSLVKGDVFFWQSLMAGALLVGLPIAIIYALLMDKFVQGITAGVGK